MAQIKSCSLLVIEEAPKIQASNALNNVRLGSNATILRDLYQVRFSPSEPTCRRRMNVVAKGQKQE